MRTVHIERLVNTECSSQMYKQKLTHQTIISECLCAIISSTTREIRLKAESEYTDWFTPRAIQYAIRMCVNIYKRPVTVCEWSGMNSGVHMMELNVLVSHKPLKRRTHSTQRLSEVCLACRVRDGAYRRVLWIWANIIFTCICIVCCSCTDSTQDEWVRCHFAESIYKDTYHIQCGGKSFGERWNVFDIKCTGISGKCAMVERERVD